MSTYVALLHSIVLGEGRRVVMSELRSMAAELGYAAPRTLIATGNLVFEAPDTQIFELEAALEAAFAKRFGKSVDIIVREAGHYRKMLTGNPFPDESRIDGGRVIVRVTRGRLSQDVPALLQPYLTAGERIHRVGDDLWVHFATQPSQSRLLGALTPRRLGGAGTLRNWNTARKIGEMLEDQSVGTMARRCP